MRKEKWFKVPEDYTGREPYTPGEWIEIASWANEYVFYPAKGQGSRFAEGPLQTGCGYLRGHSSSKFWEVADEIPTTKNIDAIWKAVCDYSRG